MTKPRERRLKLDRMLFLALAGMFIAAPTSAYSSGVGSVTLGAEPSYFTGSYGTGRTIRIYDLPLSISYRSGPWWLQAQFSYLSIEGAAAISGAAVISSGAHSGSRSGAGDLWLEGRYQLNRASALTPSASPYLKLKLPTASRVQGLGTGSFDEEAGTRLGWNISNRIYPFAQLGYRFVGRASGLNLQDAATYQAGASVALYRQHYLTLSVVGHSAIQRGTGATSEFLAAYTVQLVGNWGWQIYADHGLTTNSAQYGGGLGVYRSF